MLASKHETERYEALFTNKIILYGAGITGIEVSKILRSYFRGVEVVAFCDSYKSGDLMGLPIITPLELTTLASLGSARIIVTALAKNHEEITACLRRLEIPDENIYLLEDFDDLVSKFPGDDRVEGWYRSLKCLKTSLKTHSQRDLYLNWWCPEHYCDGDVIVYQPGKVGSSTICHSLSASGVGVTHVHMFTDAFIYDLVPELAWQPTEGERQIIRQSSQVCLDKIKSAGNLKIIGLVREPLSRDFSQCLYHLDELRKGGLLVPNDQLVQWCSHGIRSRATQNGKSKFGYQFDWFELELDAVFGINVLSHPFDQELGYSVIKEKGVELLLLKLERLEQLKEIVAAFCGISKLEFLNRNQAKDKHYINLYRSLKEKVRIPRDIFDMYYRGNIMMDHFYSEDEKRALARNWSSNLAEGDGLLLGKV